ncbi:MAG: universal stress protein [Deltaproteobacteria bacterium]|nr:universal stress protein [Deltaproteobacteria bacterium]
MKSFQKIIWAADPLEDKELRSQSIHVLRDLSKRTGARIEPVYVLSDGLLSLSVPKSELLREFKPASERALKNLAKQSRVSKLEPSTVLVSAPSSRGSAAEALDRYARSKNADLILVNSHGRHGVKRAVMGSFAETLTLHARTPVLITGPKTQAVSKLDHILFPTDFSLASRKAFVKVQELAEKLGARITIFYVVLNPIEPFVQSGAALLGGGFVTTRGYVKQVYDRQKKLAAHWAAEAQNKGLEADSAFDVDSCSVILSILE